MANRKTPKGESAVIVRKQVALEGEYRAMAIVHEMLKGLDWRAQLRVLRNVKERIGIDYLEIKEYD